MVGHDALEVIAVNFKEQRQNFLGVLHASRSLQLNCVHNSEGIASDEYGVHSLHNIAHLRRGYSEKILESFIEEIMALLPADILQLPASGS